MPYSGETDRARIVPMTHLNPLLEEMLVATAASIVVGTLLGAVIWFVTRFPPWPGLVLGEVGGLGFGIALLAIATPKRTR